VVASKYRYLISMKISIFSSWRKDIVQGFHGIYFIDGQNKVLINTPLQVLTAAPALHSLTISGRKDVADILEFLNHIHGDLRELSIKNCELGEDSTGLLANIVAVYPDLEVLSLNYNHQLKSDDCCLIAQLKNLSELNVSLYEVDYMYVQLYI